MSETERDNEAVVDAEFTEVTDAGPGFAPNVTPEVLAAAEADAAKAAAEIESVGKPYVGTDLEVAQAQPPSTLFKTDDPVQIVERATAVADALAPIIDQKNLYKNISGKKHVLVEGWTLLGTMTGVFPVLEGEVEAVVNAEGVKGFKATVSAQTMQGVVVGRATAFCMRNENRWRTADDYAVASMAQTRATSKALRIPLGFIVTLAGYEATPSEELDEQAGQTQRAQQQAGDDPARKETGLKMVRDGITYLAGKPGWSEAEILAQASLMWSRPIEKLDDLTVSELTAIYKGMRDLGGLPATPAA